MSAAKRKHWKASLGKKLLLLPPIAVGVIVLVVLARGRAKPTRVAEHELARPVRVLTLEVGDVVPRAIAYGTVKPSKTWVATAEISGRILELSALLREGEIVPAGHDLIRIDDADQKLEVARLQAEAEGLQVRIDKLDLSKTNYLALLDVDRRSLELAEAEWNRLRGLVENKTISLAEADAQGRQVLAQRAAVVKHENALRLLPSERAQLEAQKKATVAKVNMAQRAEARALIKTPFACRIEKVDVERTQPVRPGQELAVAFDVAVAEIEARIALQQASHLFRPSDREAVVGAMSGRVDWSRFGIEASVRLRLPGRTYEWEGRFARAAPSLSALTRAVGIVIAVDRPFGKAGREGYPPLLKGMFVEVELRGPAHKDKLSVPRAAIHQGRIYTVDAEDRLRIVPVEIEFVQGRDAVLSSSSSVEAGTRIVVTDLIPAIEGMLLAPQAEAAAQ